MSPTRAAVRSLISRAVVTLRSVLSWMRSYRTKRQSRREEPLILLLDSLLHQQRELQADLLRQLLEGRQELLHQVAGVETLMLREAMVPLAEAMQRQDLVQQQNLQRLVELLEDLMELQLETLNSLQPPVETQIQQLLGTSTSPRSRPSSGN